MGNRNRPLLYVLLMCAVLTLAGGCRDAVREGIVGGVTDGVAGLTESFIASAGGGVFESTWP